MNGNDAINQKLQLEMLKKQVLSKILTKEASERMGRVRIANPELANNVELYLIQLFQAGQIKGMIDDDKLKKILNALFQRSNFKIRRV